MDKLFKRNRRGKARGHYEKGLEYWGRYSMGETTSEEGKRMMSEFTKAIELDPTLAEAYSKRALAHVFSLVYEKGRNEKVEKNALKAIELNPNLAEAYFALAWCQIDTNQYEAAAENFRKVLEVDSNFSIRYYGFNPPLVKRQWFCGSDDVRNMIPYMRALGIVKKFVGKKDVEGLIEEVSRLDDHTYFLVLDPMMGKITREIGESAIEPLMKFMKDPHSKTYRDVIMPLAMLSKEIGDKRAVEPLTEALLNPDGTVRWRAAWALRYMGKDAVRRAEKPLKKALKDKNKRVRSEARLSLEMIKR